MATLARLRSLEDGQVLWIDAALSLRWERNNDVTDHPVEDGSSVSDHVSNRPGIYNIDGIISTPGILGKMRLLEQWRDERHRLQYIGRNFINNYVIRELTMEHDHRLRDSFRIRAILQEVRIASPELVELVKVDPVVEESEEEESSPSPSPSPTAPPAPAREKATSTQTKETTNKGRQQMDHSGHPALGERADRAGHPALGRAERETDRYAGHPALGR